MVCSYSQEWFGHNIKTSQRSHRNNANWQLPILTSNCNKCPMGVQQKYSKILLCPVLTVPLLKKCMGKMGKGKKERKSVYK